MGEGIIVVSEMLRPCRSRHFRQRAAAFALIELTAAIRVGERQLLIEHESS